LPFTPLCPDPNSVWCRQFGYDNAANRTVVSRSPAGVNQWDAGSFNARNQIADPNWSYDSNGNITKSPIPETLGYDAENRQVAHCTNMSADGTNCPNQYVAGSGQPCMYMMD
jgi:hypothetical protein